MSGHGHIMKNNTIYFIIFLSTLGTWIRLKYVVMMTMQGLLNFMTHRAGVLLLGRDHMSHLLLYQYTAHYLLLFLRIIMLFSYAIVDFIYSVMGGGLSRSKCQSP